MLCGYLSVNRTSSIGAQPNVELAEGCGLVTENGIKVDQTLCASDPHIVSQPGTAAPSRIRHMGTTIVHRPCGARGDLYFALDDKGMLVAVSGIGPGTALAKEFRLGERLVKQQARPDVALLSNPAAGLKLLINNER